MYGVCSYCGDSVVEPGTKACSNPEHREQARREAQSSFNAITTERNIERSAVILAREAGLPEDYFLEQLRMKKVPGLHKEVVLGVIQVIKFLNKLMEEDGETSATELFDVGIKDRREDAYDFILEFIKDGVPNLTTEKISRIAEGLDYQSVWWSVNENLRLRGYRPENPE